MTTRHLALPLFLALGMTFWYARFDARAELVTYTVDGSRSWLTVSGTVPDAPIEAQSAGGLTTNYTGSIEVDLTPTTIQFTGGQVDAMDSGVYAPGIGGGAGFAPGEYGVKADVADGHLTTEEDVATLLLPVDVMVFLQLLSPDDVQLTVTCQIVGTRQIEDVLLGDMNIDDLVDFDDIAPFVLALGDSAGYEST